LQDDDGMFRNSLNCISPSLTETALLLLLLHNTKTHVTCSKQTLALWQASEESASFLLSFFYDD